jgi:outer membrane receptor protein involved in Fe transport
MFGVYVILQGTALGATTDLSGQYRVEGIPPGDYNIEISYLGYEKVLFAGYRLGPGDSKVLDVQLQQTSLTIDEDIVIVGEKPLVDADDPRNTKQISTEVIRLSAATDVQSIINTQAGVVNNPEGIHIRGSRTYETGFYIDGVSASDPLAGTGFGIDIGTNAVQTIDVNTSASDASFGDATSGIVNTKTRGGGDHFELTASYKRDNFGFNRNWLSTFNFQAAELAFGGPIVPLSKWIPGDLKCYFSFRNHLSDEFTRHPANQLYSSLYPNTRFWSPFQDNRWSGFSKVDYILNPRTRLSLSYVKSLTINQDFNMLRITGNDVPFSPGYQWEFHLQPDKANTYTHDTNLETLNWQQTVSNRFSYRATISRLFVRLRADANGLDWRPDEVESEFNPRSIVTYPAVYFNPDDSVAFVNPGPGLFNNGGIATLWHDHYVVEYTMKYTANIYSKDARNRLTLGSEFKHQELQWIDISKPWIGAPIVTVDGDTSQSFRLGDLSDVWRVRPIKGALFISDKVRHLGLIAEIGARLEYWFPGRFVDDAVANPESPIRDEIRQLYLDQTYSVGDRRFKMRLLPKFSASFPIRENQMMYFGYNHSTVYPHPSYIYTGLDPFYADRSTQARLGNPALNPEVDISYELGVKSQITSNDALTVGAFWKDKYDFITATTILVPDVTGREVTRTMRINSDYGRIRGIELVYFKRIRKWFQGQLSGSYSIATGQSSSASESIRDIQLFGIRETTSELPLAWDSPLDIKAFAILNVKRDTGLFGVGFLNNLSVYLEAIYRTGKRYTPYLFQGLEPISGRPVYELDPDPEHRYSKLGVSNFWMNLNLNRHFQIGGSEWVVTLEITNLLNTNNTAIVNPVTGRAYQEGDAVPSEWRDPKFIDPRDPRSFGIPPDNPARYYEQRHVVLGLRIEL